MSYYWENVGVKLRKEFFSPYSIWLMFTICSFFFIFLFQTFWEHTTGQLFGKEDITNYYHMDGMNIQNWFIDKNHYATVTACMEYGYPMFTSFMFYLLTPMVFYWMYSARLRPWKAFLASFTSMYMTSYMAHATYVGILSQTLSFTFFIMMLGFHWRDMRNEAILISYTGICFHWITAFAYGTYFILVYLASWRSGMRNDKTYLIHGLIMLLMTVSSLIPFEGSTKITLSETNILTSKLDYEPSIWYVMLNMNNPILLAVATSQGSIYYIVYLIMSALIHNGRMTLFFIPFMVYHAYRDKSESQILWIMFLSAFWAIDMNLNFMGQTIEYLKTSHLWIY